MAATPIFILGRHRSGTTWISNILASLPEIYAPSHEAHWGVHESAFFSHLLRYCNHGRTDSDLRAVKYLFESSDFFALTGLAHGPEIIGRGPVHYFRSIMEAGALREGARYWLEKTPAHTLHAKFLSSSYPDAIFIAVTRDYRDVVASNVHGFGNAGSIWKWISQSMVTAIYEKIIASNGVLVIRYEELLTDYEGTLRSVMKRLGIACQSVPQSPFHRNTMYKEVPPARQWWQSIAMALGRSVIQPLPRRLIEAGVIRWRSRRAMGLPSWFFPRDGSGKATRPETRDDI
jgi:hypothetical protein